MQNVTQEAVSVNPPPVSMTAEQFDDALHSIKRQAKSDARTYNVRGPLSINEAAAIAIDLAVTEQLGAAASITHLQQDVLFWEYVDTLALYRPTVRV